MPQPGPILRQLALADIAPGPADDQRAELDPEDLRALADSISRDGLIQPIVVTAADDHYITVAGRRRREACRLAGLTDVPCLIVDTDEHHQWRASLAENLYRADLSPVDEALTCVRAIEERDLNIDQVAAAMGRSPNWVRDRLAMLSWPQELLAAVHARQLSVSAAGPLASIPAEETRNAIITEAIRQGATARITSSWAQAARASHANPLEYHNHPGPDAPPPAPVIPTQRCWACGRLQDVTALQHLPTCAHCYELIPAAMQTQPPTNQDSSAATADASSASSTPM